MVDGQKSLDTAKAVAFEEELERHLLSLVVVAEQTRHRRVLTTTLLAPKALASRARKPIFDLTLGVLAIWTTNHVKSYIRISYYLDRPEKLL